LVPSAAVEVGVTPFGVPVLAVGTGEPAVDSESDSKAGSDADADSDTEGDADSDADSDAEVRWGSWASTNPGASVTEKASGLMRR
jgi:hypothetical protein